MPGERVQLDEKPSRALHLLACDRPPALIASVLCITAKTVADGSFGSMLLKKSLSTADQNFSEPLTRFSDKNVRNLVC
jgi:hypothetical protein